MHLSRVLLALALVTALGFTCVPPFATIVIDLPAPSALLDDPTVFSSTRIGAAFDPSSAEVRLDGVDLISALGLTPPFSNAGGVVAIGAQSVTISGFVFPTSGNPRWIQFEAAGLDPGAHALEVVALKNDGFLLSRSRAFDVVGAFGLALGETTAAGLPAGPQEAAGEGVLANAVLGGALAGPPVALDSGGEVRAGIVPAAEARIAGGSPP